MSVAILCVGITTVTLLAAWTIYRQPAWLMRRMQRRWPDVLFYVTTPQKMVALTIDDGPSAHTREILQVLHAHGAKATFFLIGSHMVPGHDETLAALLADGHELANHALRDEPSRSLETPALIRQVAFVEAQIARVYASADTDSQVPQPRFFRPGSGFFSSAMRTVLHRLDYRLVLGSIYPHDAQICSWKLNAWHILRGVRPGGIIVCHDRAWTPPMLRRLLPELKRKEYRVVTVTQLLNEAGR